MRFRSPGCYRAFAGMSAALVLLALCGSPANAQGSAPETAPPLFPGGGLISYNSIFTTRGFGTESVEEPSRQRLVPLFHTRATSISHGGFYRNFDLTILVPIVTNHFDSTNEPTVRGTGLGDAMVLVKYRFYRRDSQRGTTQASLTFGPKIPTGRTDLTDGNGSSAPREFAARFGFNRFLHSRELDIHRTFQPQASGC